MTLTKHKKIASRIKFAKSARNCFILSFEKRKTRQAYHFLKEAPEEIPYSIRRYYKETQRLLSVLENRLKGREFLVGDSLTMTLADIINFTWADAASLININFDEYPNIKNWIARIEARPAVQRGLNVPDQRSGTAEVASIVKERLALI
ncbi:4195_t:CDS:2 [Paraglomus occultum]|uniref:4195_t:CDS:1 n=1 Tax=Paraglomus occultum TaxID=144539 RepID=A0A9N9D7K7_9GLOM|nr:4195_t:CDS:2 [Paraglomus occultum]